MILSHKILLIMLVDSLTKLLGEFKY